MDMANSEEARSIATKLPSMGIMLIESDMDDSIAMTSVFSGQWKDSSLGKNLNIKMIQTAQIHCQIKENLKVVQSRNVEHS